MRRVENPFRARRHMREVIEEMVLDLTGMGMLTEAASGPIAVNALMIPLNSRASIDV